MNLYNCKTNDIYSQSYTTLPSSLIQYIWGTHGASFGFKTCCKEGSKWLFWTQEELAQGPFWSGFPWLFFHVYFEEKWNSVDLLNYCPSLIFSGALPSHNPSFSWQLANIVQPRIKIMAQLKNLSSEAIHKIPFKMGFADRAYFVLHVCSITWY